MKRLLLQYLFFAGMSVFTQAGVAEIGAEPDSEKAPSLFTNPILAGGYPDPSICRDGDDFYLVNSTFEYFPGLPIHHSKDLVNWELIGHGLHRAEQVTGAVNLVDVQSDGGIHAPTLRCHQGKFYIITTNVYVAPEPGAEVEFVNFVITADDPRGPWSDPLVLEGAPGIDPDIFFDDDGRVWYVGTHSPEKPRFAGEGEIWLQQIDTDRWALTGERHFLWRGACGGVWAEGPHLYKKEGRYYLMVAEGGTSYNHAVMIAVSDEITGPYASNPRNPIMTTRHLSYKNWVNSTGHGDLVELEDGRTYMVLLGIRNEENGSSNMGRETHLVPVSWERELFWWQEVKTLWPVVAPESGRVERHIAMPFDGTRQHRSLAFSDDFDGESLKLNWNFRRVPLPDTYSLSANPGHLRLYTKANAIAERQRASLVGFRQTESHFEYVAKMHFVPKHQGAEAGIMLYQKDNNFLKFTLQKQGTKNLLSVIHSAVGNDPRKVIGVDTLGQIELAPGSSELYLRMVSKNHQYHFQYKQQKEDYYQTLATTGSDGVLSRKYTGANLGLYTTGNGTDNGDYADFDWVSYQAYERQ